ncbi:MFS transporter [Clostridium zeae]|uniref:MFS transporter n=1 Tax=Clostridium zeae TaxID=2759022 RepID=A0ABQ1EG18_9CLOT|nr:MFS transporter [Clostridium zeae]GFZ33754.1 MFS transporter [Clostridium zeae]
MNYKNRLRKNVGKNYLFILLNNFSFTNGIWMIYLASKGLTLTELGLIEGIFHITSFFMEIPTGAIADIWGRKVSRICGRMVSLLSSVIMLFSNNFLGFTIAFIISAISYNLESGAGDALVYDSLKEIDEDKKYMKISGLNELIMQVASTGGLIIGGYLSKYDYKYAYIAAIIIGLINFIHCFSFTEPKLEMKTEHKNLTILKEQVVESYNIIVSIKGLGFLLIFSQAIFMFNTSIFFYFQNYLLDNGISQDKIGIILALASLGSALVGANGYRIERKIGQVGIIAVVPILISVCIWGAALSKYYYIFFIAVSSMESLIYVVVGDYINKLIPSEKRATILSMGSMIFSAYMILIFPLIGKIGDMYTLKTSFQVIAFIATVMSIVSVFIFRRNNKKEI